MVSISITHAIVRTDDEEMKNTDFAVNHRPGAKTSEDGLPECGPRFLADVFKQGTEREMTLHAAQQMS